LYLILVEDKMETKQKVSRRDFLRMAGMAAGATVLGACAPQVVTQIVEQTKVVLQTSVVKETSVVQQTQIVQQVITPTPKPVKFTLMIDPPTADAHAAAVTAYTALNPHVTVNLQPAALPQSIVPWLAAGTAPDAFRYSIDQGPTYGLKNLIFDFAPVAKGLGIIDKFVPSVWKGYLWKDGQQWCFPTDANTFCLWSNPVVLKNAGVSAPPTNWTEFEAACKAITKPDADKTKSVYGFGIPTTIGWTTFFMYWWLWREGGDYYDGQKLIFKDPMIAALTKVRSLIKDGFLPSEDNWQAYWYGGRLGMEEFGQWVIPGDVPGPWNENAPKGQWTASYERPTFTVSPMISLEDTIPNYSILAGFGMYCPKTNPEFEETVKYLWYEISDPTAGQMWVTPYNQLPVVTGMKHPWLDTDIYKAFMKQLETTKPFPTYPEISQLVNNDWISPVLDALSGKLTPAQAVDKMYTIGDPIVKEFQALR
jgi:ABC-type glycerol-3-phosphate transport system substrate-binding protein